MPKIYGDEDTSEEEGIELADRARVAKKTAGWCRRLWRGQASKEANSQ